MPRPLRIAFPDAWYHVMNRGAGCKDIFLSAKHRELFLDLLEEASRLFGIEIHAYCLMSNHYHLLVKTPRANLARAMRHINGVYTQRFNRLTKTDGALFRGRYKAIIIEGDSYLLQVSRYIHLNPVEAKLSKSPAHYRWSSYRSYLKLEEPAPWLCTKSVLSTLNTRKSAEAYREFVETGVDEFTKTFYQKLNTPIIFGSPEFKAHLLAELTPHAIRASPRDYKIARALPSLQQIHRACVDYFAVPQNTFFVARRGQKNESRRIALYASKMWSEATLSAIATYYRCGTYSYVGQVVKELSAQLKEDKKLQRIIRELKISIESLIMSS